MILNRLSLRALIPGVLLATGLVLAGYTFFVQLPEIHAHAKEFATQAEAARMRRIQGSLGAYLGAGNQPGVDQELFYAAVDRNVDVVLLLDPHDRILYGNRSIWKGHPVTAVLPEADMGAIAAVRGTSRVIVADARLPERQLIYGGISYGGIGGKQRATLIIRSSYKATDQVLTDNAMRGTYWLLGILGVAIMSSWLLLSRLVTGRIQQLVRSTGALSSGNYAARSHVDGDDEIAHLGHAFDEMADHVAQSRRSLIDAKIAAERASRAKSDFLANMSHEIRTPLTSIIGTLSLVQEKPAIDHDTLYLTSTAHRSAEHLLDLINQILDVSKLEAGKMEMELRPTSLADVLSTVACIMRQRVEEKDLNFMVLSPPYDIFVMTDGRFIRQILLNLLANAIRFTDAGKVSMACTAQQLPNSRWAVTLKVSDTGVGISAAERSMLFRRFEQADTSLARRHEGAGLGLSITRDLVALLGGEIVVESELGKGSTFTVRIECVGAERPSDTPTLPARTVDAPPLHLLAVDDNPVNRMLIERILAGMGHKATTVDGGRAGVRAVEASLEDGGAGFDAVLMDIQMPEMDGLTALGEIRALGGKAATLPVIALTANALKGQAEKYRAAGMNGYVSKPIDPARLAAEIARVTGVHITPQTAAKAEPEKADASAALDSFTESL